MSESSPPPFSAIAGLTQSPGSRRLLDVRPIQAILVAAGAFGFLWYPLARLPNPTPIDPLWMRSVISSLCLLAAAILFHPKAARWRNHLVTALAAVVSVHNLYLLTANGFSKRYVVIIFLCVGCCGLVLANMKAFFAYTAALALAAPWLAWRAPWVPGHLYWQVGAGVATISLVTALRIWRRQLVEANTRDKLVSARDFFHEVINAIPDPLFVKDTATGAVISNRAFKDLHREDLTEAIGQGAAVTQPATKARSGGWVEHDFNLTHGDNRTATIAAKVATVSLMEGRMFQVAVLRDVSERKQLEAALETKLLELQQAHTKVMRLRGLLHKCTHCGRIRRDEDQWQGLLSYIEHNSNARFSHVICGGCLAQHHPEDTGETSL